MKIPRLRSVFLALSCLALPCVGLPAGAAPTADGLYAGFATTMGTFWCRLEYRKAPRTTANFVGLAEGTRPWIDFPTATIQQRPFYDGLTFHRVVDGFMIQGGSRNGQGTDGPGYQFADEFHADLKHSRAGILSMANSGPKSNGSQFFVTVAATPWLDGLHSVFGEVVEGYDVVQAISKVATNVNSRPLTPVVMNEVRILRVGAEATAFDPATVTPILPDVAIVPAALRYQPATTNLALLLQSRTNHFQHAFFGTDLREWFLQTFRGPLTNINATSLLGQPQVFFRVIDGGFE